MYIISSYGLVVFGAVFSLIFMVVYVLPFTFLDLKLFIIAKKVHRERAASQGKRTTVNLKNICTASWAVTCLMRNLQTL